MSKYVKDYKIILVYVEHESSIIDTSIFDSKPDVNRNVRKEWEKVSSKSSSIGEVMKKLSKEQPASSVARPIVVESVVDPFDGTSSTADDFSFGKFKEVEVEADTESEFIDLDDQFSSKEIVKKRVKKHSVETKRHLILVKNDNERVRVRCEGTIPALVLYVAIDTNMDKNVFSQTKGGPVIRENSNSGKQNILGKDKTVEGKGKKVITPKKVEKYPCPWTMLVTYTKESDGKFLEDHVIKSLATNLDIPVRAVQDQMQKQFDVGVSKMKAFRAKRIASAIMTCNYKEQYSLLREYAQELINQNPGITVRIDVQQEPNPESLSRIFRRVYVCLGALKQGFRACGKEISGLDGCFMSAESKASWCWFLNLLGEDLGIEASFNYTFISNRYCVRHIHENMKSQLKGGVYKEMLWNAAKATSEGKFKKNMGELKSFNSDVYDWLMKILLEQWSKAYFSGRAKCDLLINNIYEVFNRQLVDGRDQPIISCLEYIREYLMKRIMVVQKVIAKTVGPLTPFVTKIFDVGVGIAEQWVHAAYRLETWAHVYSFKVNPCNERDIWPIVESRIVIIPPLYKPPIGKPPKKRKKSNDEIASQSASSGKLSRKGKSVSCGKCGNVGHNKKGCRGQGGGSSQAGARKVSGQAAGATNVSGQAAGARKVSGQAVGATNVSGQAAGARKVSGQAAGSRKVSGQAAGQGFQGPIAGPASGSQRKTKKLVDLKQYEFCLLSCN
ncbi:zinc finger BED domain-containing protein RICESLEEPER 2 [Tanacetum coccineum]